MINDNPRSRSFIALCPRLLRLKHFQTSFPQKALANFHMEPPLDVGMKICSNVPGHLAKMASRPISGKKLQKSPSSEPRGQ